MNTVNAECSRDKLVWIVSLLILLQQVMTYTGFKYAETNYKVDHREMCIIKHNYSYD